MADAHTSHPASDAPAAHSGGDYHPHVVPLWMLVAVFASLLVLTVITVGARYVDLGELNLAIALAIALVKATLVVLFFMHLKWDSYFNSIAIVGAMLFVVLFIGISLADTVEYRPNINAYQMATDPPVPASWKKAAEPVAPAAPAAPAATPAPAPAAAH